MKKFKKISDIKVGAVGYGASFMIARQHLNEMKRAGMTLTCVTDIDKSRLVAAKKDFPEVEVYDSVASMLKHSDVDLVCIATPHNTHAKQSAHGNRQCSHQPRNRGKGDQAQKEGQRKVVHDSAKRFYKCMNAEHPSPQFQDRPVDSGFDLAHIAIYARAAHDDARHVPLGLVEPSRRSGRDFGE